MKKFTSILSFLSLLCVVHTTFGKENTTYTPHTYTEEHYEGIWSRKPFSLPSASSLSQATDQQYVLTGLFKMGDQWTAFLQDRKTQQRQSVSATPNKTGLQLVSVHEADSQHDSSFVVRSGQQITTIAFDPAATLKSEPSKKFVAQNPTLLRPQLNSPAHTAGLQPVPTQQHITQSDEQIHSSDPASQSNNDSQETIITDNDNPSPEDPFIASPAHESDLHHASTVILRPAATEQMGPSVVVPAAESHLSQPNVVQIPVVKPASPVYEDHLLHHASSTIVSRPARTLKTNWF